MTHKLAASVLGALLYAQALLGVAALGAVLCKRMGPDVPVAVASVEANSTVR